MLMPKLYDYRLFISHAWKYGDSYKRLTDLLDKASNFEYYNFSAPKEKPLFPQCTPLTNKKIAEAITNKNNYSYIRYVCSLQRLDSI